MIKYLSKNDDYFEIVSKGLLLVDFYAEWCGPCKMLSNVLENIDYVDILKVNTDEFPEIATKFGVMSIPTLLFYKDGLVMQKEIGYRTPEEIKNVFNNINNSSL